VALPGAKELVLLVVRVFLHKETLGGSGGVNSGKLCGGGGWRRRRYSWFKTPQVYAGNGGAGIASAISGTVTPYGGGGGSGNSATGPAGSGGVGGGGAGSKSKTVAGTPVEQYTGGGGGGLGDSASYPTGSRRLRYCHYHRPRYIRQFNFA